MNLKFLTAILFTGIIAFAVYSANDEDKFLPAVDFPQEALIYAQINDLPAFVKLWNESEFKEKYTTSRNFANFRENHLGRKLASRWKEFNEAAGFPIDLETISGLTENRASMAIYDIGKLEFVFIAPMSERVFEAAKFFQNTDKFAEEMLADDTKIYRVAIDADRGRQKQELIFTNVKGRFILATSEKLISQTLNNINENQFKKRLSDEAPFKLLSGKIEPHLATVWINQAALNDNYYFKRYWLMKDVKELKNMRAGIFDIEMSEGKLIERRKFLLAEANQSLPIEPTQAAEMLTYLPEKIPLYRMRTASRQAIDETVQKTLFERSAIKEEKSPNRQFYNSTIYFNDDYSSGGYNYLNGKFDESVDDIDVEELVESRKKTFDFSQSFQTANPSAILDFTRPQISPAPLFVEFKRAAVFQIISPNAFNRDYFESAIKEKFAAQTMISPAVADFKWETNLMGNVSARELNLPMLGWKAVYVIRGNELILANDADFFQEIMKIDRKKAEIIKPDSSFSFLTVVNFSERESAFDQLFDDLGKKNAAETFFTGNIESLLDSISDVEKLEIKRNYLQNTYEEELIFYLKIPSEKLSSTIVIPEK